jgi:hypothetical protein
VEHPLGDRGAGVDIAGVEQVDERRPYGLDMAGRRGDDRAHPFIGEPHHRAAAVGRALVAAD